MTGHKVLDLPQLHERLSAERAAGKTIVQCHGCFDIVHPGHIRYLRFARQQGDVLVVSVSSDETVNKGYDRPHIPARHRLENLAELECVDYVVLDDHDWAGPILDFVQPDVYVKGKEYENKGDPRFTKERALVEEYGGRVIFSSGDVVYSSTALIRQYGQRFQVEQDKIAVFCQTHRIDRTSLSAQLRSMVGLRVLVVGDAILDRYIHCESAGVASESPMLSVRPVDESWFAGGAAFIARQLHALGADVTLIVPMTPQSDASRRFADLMAASGVHLHVVECERRPASVKERFLVEERKILKVDRGVYAPLSAAAMDAITERVEHDLPSQDGIVLVDYGYGLFGPSLSTSLPEAASRYGKPYYADISSSGKVNLLKFQGARLLTPTEAELRFAFADEGSGISNLASRYFQSTQSDNLIVTLGRKGSIHFARAAHGRRLPTAYLPAHFALPLDVVGAGDAFLAAVVLSDLSDQPVAHGMYLGSAVASAHVGVLGNNPVDLPSLEALLDARTELRQ